MRTLPKGPERLYCEIGMLGIRVPEFWKILENVPRIIRHIWKSLLKLRITPRSYPIGGPIPIADRSFRSGNADRNKNTVFYGVPELIANGRS